MKSLKIPDEIEEIVKNAAQKKNIANFHVVNFASNDKGEGFLGEVFFLTIKDEVSKKQFSFAIKKSFDGDHVREKHPIRLVFVNEIYFYSHVWPALNQIQTNVENKFNSISKLVAVSVENCTETIVMDDLKVFGFEVFDKKQCLDEKHVRKTFQTYGKFHALSFALKHLNNKEYSKLTTGLIDMYEKFNERPYFINICKSSCEAAMRSIDDPKIIEYFQKFIDHTGDIFYQNLKYQGPHSAIVHGDSWQNNMMFKYDKSRQLIDIHLIDFQLARIGTPIHDLSYCVYAGASSAVYNNLTSYLHVYMEAFTAHYQEIVGEKPPFTIEDLKSDWIKYNKFGFIMALFVWKLKTTNKEDTLDVSHIQQESDTQSFTTAPYDIEFFNKNVKPLVIHLHQLDTVGFE